MQAVASNWTIIVTPLKKLGRRIHNVIPNNNTRNMAYCLYPVMQSFLMYDYIVL